jgi:prophage regulatory protein
MSICKNRNQRRPFPPDLKAPSGDSGVPPQADESILRSGPIRMLRLAQVIDITGLGKTKIYELQSEGSFPMRVQITAHSVGWIEEEVQAWLARRVAASNSLPARRHQTPRRPSA